MRSGPAPRAAPQAAGPGPSPRSGRAVKEAGARDEAAQDRPLGALRVVLVETTHPGNVGAVARAMHTMGVARLALVRPVEFRCAEATARAAGADEVLYRASEHDTLEAALAGCRWVAGTTARARRIGAPAMDPRTWAGEAARAGLAGDLALVLGRESSGLTNAELDRCQALVHIPANPSYSSLNLAAAAQVLCYEYRQAVAGPAGGPRATGDPDDPEAGAAELEGLFAHLEQAMTEVGYYDAANPKLLMRRLRRLFTRARPLRSEVNILRGILSAATRAARRHGR